MRRAEALFCPHPMERSNPHMTLELLFKLFGTSSLPKLLLLLFKLIFA